MGKPTNDRNSERKNRTNPLNDNAKQKLEEAYREFFYEISKFVAWLFANSKADWLATATDVFVKLGEQYAKGVEIDNPRAWLYRTARNAVYDVLKRQKRRADAISIDGNAGDDDEKNARDFSPDETKRPNGTPFYDFDPVKRLELFDTIEFFRRKILIDRVGLAKNETRAFLLFFEREGKVPEPPTLLTLADALGTTVANARAIRDRMFQKLKVLYAKRNPNVDVLGER